MTYVGRRAAIAVGLLILSSGCTGDLSVHELQRVARQVPVPASAHFVRERSSQDRTVTDGKFNVVTREYFAPGNCAVLLLGWGAALKDHEISYRVVRGPAQSPMLSLYYRSSGAGVTINLDYPRCTKPFTYIAKSRG